jgi:GNAT superfamily N-acetyltransferase
MSKKPLDNPVWHALGGPQSDFALKRPFARRFDPEIGPFFAIEEPSDKAFRDMDDLMGASSEAWLVRSEAVDVPEGWRKTFEKKVAQMILPPTATLPPVPSSIIELGAGDLPGMRELAAHAKPGPFATRTHELGTFLGIHEGDRLVAMAGERFRLPGLVEISAVSTQAEYRGRGYGTALLAAVAARIRAAGQMPFLHLYADNEAALKLYRKMGFAQRTTLVLTGLALRKPAAGDDAEQ